MTHPIPRACVMGHPVAHSRSPMIHGYWLRTLGIAGAYELEDILPADFAVFLSRLREKGYVGGNVTVPHKEVAYRTVDRRDAAAEAIGAVNTVWFEDGLLFGGNSDAHGFLGNLDERAPGWDVPHGCTVMLGAGGAARSAVHALLSRGMEVLIVNRTIERAAELAAHFGAGVTAHRTEALPELLPKADLLVNCTSLGMVSKPPLAIDLGPLRAAAVVHDVVYVPLETELLAAARRRGHRTVDGLGMLLHQAGFGFRKWFGATPVVTAELRSLVEDDIRAKTARA